eukprot:CAMPEP_0119393148 /NCGR_PEP_ID=MMETSP1334-20130426/124389_1 /TAXON_ID=127549 /ORGANISM="Calcidiscus leptoporus, Strain RCC1130" /LENGTH=178 /DNA_ID=CAMNT_0007416155 /DNA_START=41 /DNA_END=574 /DNA_ORIENTATION=+
MNKEKPELATCLPICDLCFCWVCDEPAKTCKQWQAHCLCNGSVEWTAARQKAQRLKKASAEAALPGESAADISARFTAATTQDEARIPLSQAEETARMEREQRAEDEENEALFADYEPLHYKHGQAHPDPVVETTSLSFAELPTISYTLKLPEHILQPRSDSNRHGGTLSRLQLETVS